MAVLQEKVEELVRFAGNLEVNNEGTGGSKVYKKNINLFITTLDDEQLSLLVEFILDGLQDGEAKRNFTRTLGVNSLAFRTLLADIKSQINLLNSKPEYEVYYRTFGLIEYLQEKRPELIEEPQKTIESVKDKKEELERQVPLSQQFHHELEHEKVTSAYNRVLDELEQKVPKVAAVSKNEDEKVVILHENSEKADNDEAFISFDFRQDIESLFDEKVEDTSNDELIARLLQEQFDEEQARLKQEQEVANLLAAQKLVDEWQHEDEIHQNEEEANRLAAQELAKQWELEDSQDSAQIDSDRLIATIEQTKEIELHSDKLEATQVQVFDHTLIVEKTDAKLTGTLIAQDEHGGQDIDGFESARSQDIGGSKPFQFFHESKEQVPKLDTIQDEQVYLEVEPEKAVQNYGLVFMVMLQQLAYQLFTSMVIFGALQVQEPSQQQSLTV